jgi:hypothetical protein
MTLKGWVKVHESKTWDEWINTWFPHVKSSRKQKIENKVKVIKTVAGWWQVWATSAPHSEIGAAKTKAGAVKKAVAFMKKYPSGHPEGIQK